MVHGIILASGFSKRMGKNKLLEIVDGKCLIEYVLETALQSKLDGVWVVYQDQEVLGILKKYPVIAVHNDAPENGQSEALKKGISAIKNSGAYLFMVGDQPLMSVHTLNRLIEAYESSSKDVIIPFYGGVKGNPVLFSNRLRPQLMSLKGDEGGRQILRNAHLNIETIEIEDSEERFDVDSPDDLLRIRGMMKEKNRSLNSDVKSYKMDRDE